MIRSVQRGIGTSHDNLAHISPRLPDNRIKRTTNYCATGETEHFLERVVQ
jgi:hypothetical protein